MRIETSEIKITREVAAREEEMLTEAPEARSELFRNLLEALEEALQQLYAIDEYRATPVALYKKLERALEEARREEAKRGGE